MPHSKLNPPSSSAGASAPTENRELALLAGLRRGEAAAFEELVRLHGPRMLAVAQRLLRSSSDAQDAVQDAFLSAFRGLSGFQGDARLSTWLHRVTVNACLMRLRTQQRRPEEPIEPLLPQFRADGHALEPFTRWSREELSASAQLESEEARAMVRAAIDRLPENYRTVLILRDIEDLSTAETAAALGLSDNVVKIRLHRARQALRTLLAPHFGSSSC